MTTSPRRSRSSAATPATGSREARDQTLRFPAFPGNEQRTWRSSRRGGLGRQLRPAMDRTFVARSRAPPAGRRRSRRPCSCSRTQRGAVSGPAGAQGDVVAIDRQRLVTSGWTGTTRTRPTRRGCQGAIRVSRPHRDRRVDKARSRGGGAAARRGGAAPARGQRGAPVELIVVAGWSDWIRVAQLVARDLGEVGLPVRGAHRRLQRLARSRGARGLCARHRLVVAGGHPLRLLPRPDVERNGAPAGGGGGRQLAPLRLPRGRRAARANRGDGRAPGAGGAVSRARGHVRRRAARHPPVSCAGLGGGEQPPFVGFPSQDNPWATLSPNRPPETLLVLTALEPR